MGLDFQLYEIIDYSYENRKTGFMVKEVLYLSNATASILTKWLYRNNSSEISDKSDETGSYIIWYGSDILDLLDNLDTVLKASENRRDLLALHYFPTNHTCEDFIDTCVMFSEDYYDRLKEIHEAFAGLIHGDYKDDKIDERNRRFVYNISW